MAIFRRGKCWWYNFWFEGQHVQRPTKVTSLALALKMQAIHKAQLAQGKYGLGEKKVIPKFAEFGERYLDYSKNNKAAYSVEQYYIPKGLTPFFGKFPLNEITPLTVEKYKQKRLEGGLKKSSINREIGLLKSMLNTAVKWQLLDANPTRDAKLFKLEDSQVERVLAYVEEDKLLAACDDPELRYLAPHLKPIIMVALYTGLRRGEPIRLLRAFHRSGRRSDTAFGQSRHIPATAGGAGGPPEGGKEKA